MRFSRLRREIVAAVAVAVIAALGLAASVSYGFSSASTKTSTTIPGIDCTKTNPPMLNLPAGSVLKEDGTSVINGAPYWYVSFIQGNLTTVNFHGVQFAFNSGIGVPRLPNSTGSQIEFSNATLLTGPHSPGSPTCGGFLPQITITFPDGSSVVYNKETITLTAIGANITWAKPLSNPWFTPHVSPQAGVAFQTDGEEITLYVSAS